MKHLKSLLFFLFIATSFCINAQERPNGIGLRVGDPLGITYKKYGSENSYEAIFGRALYQGDRYYYKRYSKVFYKKYDSGYSYLGTYYVQPFALAFHFLKNYNINSIAGLYWYFGAGPQIRFGQIQYVYKNAAGLRIEENAFQFDVGANAVIGAEYAFQDAPISIFAELGLNLELWNMPFALWGIGGVGARFRF